MAKGKKKGGLSGVSRFVFESMSSTPANSGATKDTSLESPKAAQSRTLNEPPTKKRKGNDGTSIAQLSDHEEQLAGWVEKYNAVGLVPHYTQAEQVPEHLQKYFSQRLRFFSLYDSPPGCLLDDEGWYSVTPELVANQIAERCRCDTILDAFCGVGGNAIAFAKTCQRVIALDTSPTRLALARHNAQIYGVADRIEFILSDYLSFAKSYLSLPSTSRRPNVNLLETRKIDVVFLSPPWGGPSYLAGATDERTTATESLHPPFATPTSDSEHPSFTLSSINPIHGAALFDLTRRITKNVAYYLPRNTRLEEISALLSEQDTRISKSTLSSTPAKSQEKIEIEEEWMGNKLKALTCYFGGLVQGQEDLF